MAKKSRSIPSQVAIKKSATDKKAVLKLKLKSAVKNGRLYDTPNTTRPGVHIERHFTSGKKHPYSEVQWEKRDAVITGKDGKPVFEQKEVEFPKFWSQTASNIVASKYFRGRLGTPEREKSLKQLLDRVADTITNYGLSIHFFDSERSAKIFNEELKSAVLYQRMSFNSPVWFNIGVEGIPQQASACFILKVEDNMESILKWFHDEGMIFKGGSGSGINVSTLRSKYESLSGGGTSSGPVSFMRGADSVAGSIKSGGTTRRAAKMVILNADHPDLEDFINTKKYANALAWLLAKEGYKVYDLDDPIWDHIQFQNANNSVRVTEEFLKAILEDRDWEFKAVTDGRVVKTVKARDLWDKIVDAAWDCADPGLQFDTTINNWHTCPNSGRINGSNPCSEYMHVDNSACNLASLNLMKFAKPNRGFDTKAFRYTARIAAMAQELLVGLADYPTSEITANAKAMRQLGQGYCNLGALLMYHGYAYDSDAGREYAAAITAIMTGEVYRTSAEVSRDATGPYDEYEKNKLPHNRVMGMHRDAAYKIPETRIPKQLPADARQVWDEVIDLGVTRNAGFRNAQATVLAPTGTIGFMMDADTTGVEPDFALVKTKRMVGGGVTQLVNQTVSSALKNLGYTSEEVDELVTYLKEHGNIETSPVLKEEHKEVFDCATTLRGGARSIAPMGHVLMMAATQPFISGAISKTCNLPANATKEDVAKIYMESGKLGLKAIAIYRDGCKPNQPLSTDNKSLDRSGTEEPKRRRMPDTRPSLTHKVKVGAHEAYVTVGLFEDGKPGEIFISMSKEGSTLSGMIGAFALQLSLALQYGVPAKDLVRKHMYTRFEPSGWTGDPKLGLATSMVDAIMRWFGHQFLTDEEKVEINLISAPLETAPVAVAAETGTETSEKPVVEIRETVNLGTEKVVSSFELIQSTPDAPPCPQCGLLMVRNGSCHKCLNCGSTSGCS